MENIIRRNLGLLKVNKFMRRNGTGNTGFQELYINRAIVNQVPQQAMQDMQNNEEKNGLGEEL